MRRWRRYGTHRKGKILFAVVLACLFIFILDRQLRPVIESITTNEAKIKSTNTINSAIMEDLQKDGVTYSDLITVERGSDGSVLSITTNMVKMNELKSEIIATVQKDLGDNAHLDVGVPLGTLVGGDIFHGRGPNVPLKLTLSGNVTADFESSFESAGINQTRHQIYLKVHTSVYSFLPGFDTTTDVDTNMLVAETVIVGSVPEIFADLK